MQLFPFRVNDFLHITMEEKKYLFSFILQNVFHIFNVFRFTDNYSQFGTAPTGKSYIAIRDPAYHTASRLRRRFWVGCGTATLQRCGPGRSVSFAVEQSLRISKGSGENMGKWEEKNMLPAI